MLIKSFLQILPTLIKKNSDPTRYELKKIQERFRIKDHPRNEAAYVSFMKRGCPILSVVD